MFVSNLKVPLPEGLVMDGYNFDVKDSGKLVGAVVDSKLNCCKFIIVCARFYYNLRRFSFFFRKHMSLETTEILISTFVTSWFEYCISLLYGLSEFLKEKLQSE